MWCELSPFLRQRSASICPGSSISESQRSLMYRPLLCTTIFLIALVTLLAMSQNNPVPAQGDFIIRNFKFDSGEILPELKLHYRTYGTPRRDGSGLVRTAVLVRHGTGGSGAGFISDQFAGVLFKPGQLLDPAKYFIILPDGIGHGQSSKPSDGLHARFPRYDYNDMVTAQYRLLTEGLGVNHLKLVMGTSMGGMDTWLGGANSRHYMDAS